MFKVWLINASTLQSPVAYHTKKTEPALIMPSVSCVASKLACQSHLVTGTRCRKSTYMQQTAHPLEGRANITIGSTTQCNPGVASMESAADRAHVAGVVCPADKVCRRSGAGQVVLATRHAPVRAGYRSRSPVVAPCAGGRTGVPRLACRKAQPRACSGHAGGLATFRDTA